MKGTDNWGREEKRRLFRFKGMIHAVQCSMQEKLHNCRTEREREENEKEKRQKKVETRADENNEASLVQVVSHERLQKCKKLPALKPEGLCALIKQFSIAF